MCARDLFLGPVLSLLPLQGIGQWQSLNGGVSQEVRAFDFFPDTSHLFIGGKFVWVEDGNIRANGLATWNGTEWSVVGCGNGNGDTSFFGNTGDFIVSLSHRDDTLFAGLLCDSWHYEPYGLATILSNEQWSHCGDPENWFFVNDVNGRLFSYGRADTLYGQYMPNVREWIDGEWQTLPGSPFDQTGSVFASEYWQGEYYFGGNFFTDPYRGIVKYDGASEWSALAQGVGGTFIRAMAGFGDSLYVGGFLPLGPNVQSTHIQIWDGNAWRPFFPEVEYYGTVMDIQVHNGALYVAGIFHFAGETTWYDLLRFDGHQLCAIGGPTPSGDNGEIEFFQGDLYMALGATFEALPNEFIGRLPLSGLVPDTCITVVPNAVIEHGFSASPRIVPNPAYADFQILGLPFTTEHLVVVDMTGRVVQTVRLPAAEISVSQLLGGTYAVHAFDKAGTRLTSLLLIKH